MFSHREFRRLWTATIIDAFGSWLLMLAVPLHVYRSTGSVGSTALTLAVEAAPALLVGLWAGALVDRWPRRRVLVLGNLAAAIGVAVLPFSIYGGLLAENIAVCFVRPALTATLPTVVGTGPELAAANAWTSAGNSVLRMLGPPIGTLLVARGDFGVVVLVDAASYLIAAALLTRLGSGLPGGRVGSGGSGLSGGRVGSGGSGLSGGRVGSGGAGLPDDGAGRGRSGEQADSDWAGSLGARVGPGRAGSPDEGAGRGRPRVSGERVVVGVLAELRAGLVLVARTKMLSGLVATTWVFWAANAALTILLVPLAGASLGWLIAGLGLGYLLGSAIAKTLIIRYATRPLLTVCFAAVGVCFAVAFAVPALPVIAVAGVPGAVIAVAVGFRVQKSTPDRLLGRVSTVLLVSDASAAVAGALIAPLLGTVTLSAMVLAVAAMALVLLPGGGP